MASSNLTFDGGQFKVRSNTVNFSNKYFYIKAHVFVAQNFLMPLVFFYDA